MALAVGLFFVGCTQPTNTSTTTTSGTTTGGTTTTTSSYTVVSSATSAVLAKNSTYNNQGVVEWLTSDNTKVFQSGESLTITITATASAAAGELKAFLVDNTAAASWWNQLSSYANSGTNISTGSTTYTFTLTGTAAASSAAPAACKLALYFEPVQDDSVTLTISSITVQ